MPEISERRVDMNKADLIDAIAKKAEMTKKDAGIALDAIIESISASLVKAKRLHWLALAHLTLRDRKARTGVNPRTKEKLIFLLPRLLCSRQARS